MFKLYVKPASVQSKEKAEKGEQDPASIHGNFDLGDANRSY